MELTVRPEPHIDFAEPPGWPTNHLAPRRFQAGPRRRAFDPRWVVVQARDLRTDQPLALDRFELIDFDFV